MTSFEAVTSGNAKITDSDRQILGLLQQNARRSISEIANITGLARGTVKDRIDMLVDRQVIKKFTIELSDVESPAQNTVAAFFLIKSKRPICRVIYASIRAWPELVGCWSIAGDLDMVVLLQSTKIDELHKLRDKLACHPEVKWLQTLSILTEWTSKLNFTGREFLERIGQPVLEDLVETLPTTRERVGTESMYNSGP